VTSEEEYALDNYGTCDREADCYWGKDAAGRFDGCLRVGWRGRDCPHWHPKPAQNGLRAGPARLQGAFLGLAAPGRSRASREFTWSYRDPSRRTVNGSSGVSEQMGHQC
jgi:hypothetical protein